MCRVYRVQCKLYTLFSYVYNRSLPVVQFAVNSVTVYSEQCTVNNEHSTLLCLERSVPGVQFTMYIFQCLLHSPMFRTECTGSTTYSVQCTLYSPMFKAECPGSTVYSVQWQCTLYSHMFKTECTWSTVYSVQWQSTLYSPMCTVTVYTIFFYV